jgi:hypothetical protein
VIALIYQLEHKIHNKEVLGSNTTIYSLDVSDAITLKEKEKTTQTGQTKKKINE